MSFGGKFILLSLGLCLTAELWASGNGVCNGRSLPSDRDRKWRNHYLACSSDVSHFLREPMLLPEADRKKWADLSTKARALKNKEYREEMQALGQKLPLIEWNGRLLYETVEHWDWTAWEYGADPVCGYDEHTTCYTDKDGKEQCTTTYTMRSCWHDVDHSESRHCSNEVLPFNANFHRPTTQQWGPDAAGVTYYDELPNKYDLLPGESEDVQIYNTGNGLFSSGDSMKPYVAVGDAWNKYKFDIQPTSMACVFGGGGYHLNVIVYTEGRTKKRSPNPFRLPVNRFGKDVEPIQWTMDHSMAHGLLFSDASAVVISSMARNSRAFGQEAEIAKAEAEQSRKAVGSNQKEVKEANESGFDKDTRFRLKLIKVIDWARDVRTTENFYGRGAQFAKGAKSEHYEVDLQDFYHASGPWSDRLWHWVTSNAEPGYKYEFRLSMYQKGVPFYYQEEDFYVGGENNWFSKELPIAFEIPTTASDHRGGTQKLADYYGKGVGHKLNPMNFVRAWWSFFTE